MEPFDAAHWKKVNDALDEALEIDENQRENWLADLGSRDAKLAAEVVALLKRVQSAPDNATLLQTAPLATAVVKPGLTTAVTQLYGAKAITERGFDGLLQRALRAERSTHKSARYRGEVCGAWRIEEIIGTGGMGEVWLAHRADGMFESRAAVKFLRADGDTSRFEARFGQERALLARLNHPGVARLLDAGRQFGAPFLVLEYVDGTPLLDYANTVATTLESRLALIRQIADAIIYAHTQLVVHRDLKPSNVLVTAGGQVKLLDFGVAGLLADAENDEAHESAVTRTAGRGLTLEYAAPEQITGDATGVASDVYSLGALSFHLITGRRAFLPERSGRAALEYAILHTDAPRASDAARLHQHHVSAKDNIAPPTDAHRINADVDAIVSRAMRRNPADRYATAGEFAADLRRFAEHRPIATRRHDRAYQTRLWFQRNRLPAALGTTLALALVVGLGVSLFQADRARSEAARATKTADYFVELLGGADPDLNGGEWPTALMLLERAQTSVGQRFSDDPATEARLSSLVANTFRSLSRDTEALPLAERAAALTASLYGKRSMEHAKAQLTLGTVLYWLERENEALPTLESAIQTFRDGAALDAPGAATELQRTQLVYANTLARLQRFDESTRVFDDHFRALNAQGGDTVWERAAAEADFARALMAQGRWADAYALLLKNEAVYDSPPKGREKLALHNRLSLVSAQSVVGRYEGAEARLKALLVAWKRLAGDRSSQVFDVLNDLGYLYYRVGQGDEAERTYEELSRLQALVPDFEPLRRASTQVDLLEIRLLFARIDRKSAAANALQLIETVRQTPRAESDRAVWLVTRLGMILDASGEPDQAARSYDVAQSLGQAAALADGHWMRRIERGRASLWRQTDELDKAVPVLQSTVDRLTKTRTTGYSQRWVGANLELALALSRSAPTQAKSALSAARAGLAEALPATHYARVLTAYVAAVVEAGGVTSPETEAAFEALHRALAGSNPQQRTISAPLPGFFFL
ncbi:MAG: serine/threonine protein kinase [Betaproteobacteria bacterium]|nr:MAG: serine/threonine protein kinase [Betaproteobacteria bacterium]